MMFRKLALSLVATVGLAAPAAAITLDFDTGTAVFSSTNVLSTYEQDGYRFGFALGSGSGSVGPNLFDTNACLNNVPNVARCNNGDDFDLVPASLPSAKDPNGVAGNVLIRQETNGNINLDDDAGRAGSIIVTLLEGPSPIEVRGFSAVDEQPIKLFVGGVLQGTVDNAGDRDTGSIAFVSPMIKVGESFEIHYAGSGGVDGIEISAVPLPAGLSLLLAGLGGLAVFRRRQRA